ncbi:hypothetical protein [Lentzea sp. NPDC003310]|uniref:hypothetical protein n=1 Tax=Lentzea sp. NPDC003310 TaxID=3154447 RepID=UPI0033B7A358
MDEEAWRADRAREFASLNGRHVQSWIGVEFALRENTPDAGPHVFRDPAVPCLQLWGLQAVLADGRFGIGTYQHHDCWGLWKDTDTRVQDPDHWREPHSGTRWRVLDDELPVGPITEVTVYGDEGVVAEVRLTIGGRPLLLVAGEADETWSGELQFLRLDESVLAFTDPAKAAGMPWTTPRGRLEIL